VKYKNLEKYTQLFCNKPLSTTLNAGVLSVVSCSVTGDKLVVVDITDSEELTITSVDIVGAVVVVVEEVVVASLVVEVVVGVVVEVDVFVAASVVVDDVDAEYTTFASFAWLC
jgi:hypothetical protein